MNSRARRVWLTAVFAAIMWLMPAVAQQVVRYDLTLKDTLVNYTGKTRKAMAINGQIPGPVLTFTEGDTARIYVHNRMHHESSIHWHGILLPNVHDGVPNLTTAPIKPHTTHVFEFPIRQTGTYWYHSHTMLQEQLGLYGAFVIHPRQGPDLPEEVLLLSDWSDEKPHQIERRLHQASDWYMIRKKAVQAYGEAITSGHLGTKLESEWKRMHAMDVSDVYYDRFLINGQPQVTFARYEGGDKVRVRIINGSSSTYFWITAGGPMQVIASDGMEVEPVAVDRLIIGVSETYDVLVSLPHPGMKVEVRATAEDRTGQVSAWLGSGMAMAAEVLGRLRYFEGMAMMNDMMTLGGRMDDMGMEMGLQQMDMNAVMYPEAQQDSEMPADDDPDHAHHNMPDPETAGDDPVTLNYTMLRSPVVTTLPEAPWTTLRFELNGNMNRYVWSVNNKVISEADKILIRGGENIRIILTNQTMMRHPMHLHGHFFRVVNGQGAYAPLKNVLDIMPMETDTIEFHAGEENGDWFFHCHILYHMMAGMGRIFTYEGTPPNPQLPDPERALKLLFREDRRWYPGAEIDFWSSGIKGEATLINTRWTAEMEWRAGYRATTGYEWEGHIGRHFGRNQWLQLYAGWDWRYRADDDHGESLFGQTSTANKRGIVCLGAIYTLPGLIDADFRLDHTGYLRLTFSRHDIPLTTRLRLGGMVNTDGEYAVDLAYRVSKTWALAGGYDSDLGWGAGVRLIY